MMDLLYESFVCRGEGAVCGGGGGGGRIETKSL